MKYNVHVANTKGICNVIAFASDNIASVISWIKKNNLTSFNIEMETAPEYHKLFLAVTDGKVTFYNDFDERPQALESFYKSLIPQFKTIYNIAVFVSNRQDWGGVERIENRYARNKKTAQKIAKQCERRYAGKYKNVDVDVKLCHPSEYDYISPDWVEG